MTQQTPHEIVLSMLREVIDDGDYVIGDAAREMVERMRAEHPAALAAFLDECAEELFAQKLRTLKRSISAHRRSDRAAVRFDEAAEAGGAPDLTEFARAEAELLNRAFEAAASAKKAT